ncbi:hypothetical protein E3N88_25715 [Mikania micrantha]|uniref:Uncharacterized protein n=1 Tax=Mikania micrantha TaxID=192012 RepID=A0A5N6N618_9ASTR|nr:hypothetical protein E3N88_25715 [Mikania micrantha]
MCRPISRGFQDLPVLISSLQFSRSSSADNLPEMETRCKLQETNLEAFIGDKNHGKEEYPGVCSDIYMPPPCFDDYGDEEGSKNDYLWVSKVLNGAALREGGKLDGIGFLSGSRCGSIERSIGLNEKSLNRRMTRYANSSDSKFDEFLKTYYNHRNPMGSSGGVPVALEDRDVLPVNQQILETQTTKPIIENNLNVNLLNFDDLLSFNFRKDVIIVTDSIYKSIPIIEDNIYFPKFVASQGVGGPFRALELLSKVSSNTCNEELCVRLRILEDIQINVRNKGGKVFPFDPGGFDLKSKLEDEFSLRWGE